MVRHIVMWKLKDSAEGNGKARNAQIIKERLEGLKEKISQIEEIEVGINSDASPAGNYDVVLVMTCKDFAALKEYAEHPDHVEAGSFVKKVVEARAAVDYEY
ncbi:stress responsive A/B barrel domain protein (plasmid) [Peptoclostridium acidaminophilum DSM 3953]|uniref:Stress responsive A/B barrel domain protein n=1 Tax=Peptoclostridium acidaminophilum DSM 3953 TaxID=1286171 RepID=W8U9N0_PEPAC|nr:Dabb family protein [Peptoclostridium acidaminophilum]AHM57561.1 stress responsive A/B barrel domain protein [Peptoclostridium acidaminophilum DSM 3953]